MIKRRFIYENRFILATMIIMLLVGGIVGYAVGSAVTLNWAVDKGLHFLSLKGIEVDVDKEELTHALNTYHNAIGEAYDEKNR